MGKEDSDILQDFSQKADDQIDAAVEDPDPLAAVDRLDELLSGGIPKSQAASAYQVLGARLEDAGATDRAIECYAKSLDFEPENAIVLFWKGQLLFQNDQFDKARADLEKALAVTSSGALVWPDRDDAARYLAMIEARS